MKKLVLIAAIVGLLAVFICGVLYNWPYVRRTTEPNLPSQLSYLKDGQDTRGDRAFHADSRAMASVVDAIEAKFETRRIEEYQADSSVSFPDLKKYYLAELGTGWKDEPRLLGLKRHFSSRGYEGFILTREGGPFIRDDVIAVFTSTYDAQGIRVWVVTNLFCSEEHGEKSIRECDRKWRIH